MVDVHVRQEDPVVHRPPLVDTIISMIPKKKIPTPKQQPPQTQPKQSKTKLLLKKSKKTEEEIDVLKRLTKLEKKVEAMSKINHTEAIEDSIQISVMNEVKNQFPKFLPQAVPNKAITNGELDPTKTLRKRHHDDDQDPLEDSEKEKNKKRRKDTELSKQDKDQAGSSKKGKAPSKTSKTDKTMNVEESIKDAAMDAKDMTHDDTWFNELVNDENDPVTFDDLMGSTIDFTKFAKHFLKKDKITKADLEGPNFRLLKGNYKNSIELEYNMEQCYLALTNQIDWANSEGDKCLYDLSKPLQLQGPPGRISIPMDLFFNKDLEYLKTTNSRNHSLQ
ncbi:hypothetical protein Tco_0360843 [Tanacetum coccineum]